jgi:hypothetical protein
MKYYQLIDDLMQYYAAGDFGAEAVQAKNEFFDLAGIFDGQSNFFEQRMAQFTDWYLFSRVMPQYGLTPIEHFMQVRPEKVSSEDMPYYKNLSDHRLSLFEFLKIKGSDLHVRDLFSNYKLVIKNSVVTVGFTPEEYFQGRLFPHEDSFVFSSAFCFHPQESTNFIQKEIKIVKKLPVEEQKKAREKLILRLFRMRNKFDQYRHVGIKEIYSNDSRLKI